MVTENDNQFSIARKRMISEQLVSRGIKNPRVVDVMTQVPRHLFVDEALKAQAYIDAPLNIGEGQTISQPYIVALMTQTLELNGSEKVLEIGTGCGYQTTILASLAKQVYTIERIKTLAMQARSRFKQLGMRNVILRVGDGSLGWKEGAPFDRILVTCAAPVVPEALLAQLNVNGYIVIPVEAEHGGQDLLKVTKTATGYKKENLGPCRFVPLIGKQGY
jgi:protein-L-isoaspartate(D-aspartate) O-methyltransferase